MRLKRTKQKAVFPREHGEFRPPLPLQGMIITPATGSCHTEALQVSPAGRGAKIPRVYTSASGMAPL